MAGLPRYMQYGSVSVEATEPTLKTEWVLIVIPGQTTDFAPIHTPSSRVTGLTIRSKV